MSGPGLAPAGSCGPGLAPGTANSAAARGSCGPGLGPDTLRSRLRHSEAKRLELERKLMEYIHTDAYQIQLKRMKLKKYLKEIEERQKRAVARNQALLKEIDEFEARLKTSSSETIQKMEAWYEGEIKKALSLQEGSLSAAGDKEAAAKEQVPQAGSASAVSTRAAVSPTGALGTLQKPLQPTESCSAPNLSVCSSSLNGLGLDSRSVDLESSASAEGAASCGEPAAGEEGSEQPISSASDPKPAAPEEERPRRSIPGPKPVLSTWWPCEEVSGESSAEPPGPASTEEATPQGRATCAAQGPPLHPPSLSPASSAPHGFCNGAGSLKDDDLEAREAAVLHQLRPLFAGALNGCLPPEKTLHAEGRAADEKQTRPEQREAAVLQTHLSNHALFSKKHQVPLPEEVAETFERLLLSDRAQDGQAAPALREVLPEERADRSPVQSSEASGSSPCGPRDGAEPAAAKQAPQLARGAGGRGRGAGDNGSRARGSQEMRLGSSSSSSERSPPFPRTETRRGTVTAIKSKAFWGKSDDSSSEIEAALRPQSHSPEADEFDDFYD